MDSAPCRMDPQAKQHALILEVCSGLSTPGSWCQNSSDSVLWALTPRSGASACLDLNYHIPHKDCSSAVRFETTGTWKRLLISASNKYDII